MERANTDMEKTKMKQEDPLSRSATLFDGVLELEEGEIPVVETDAFSLAKTGEVQEEEDDVDPFLERAEKDLGPQSKKFGPVTFHTFVCGPTTFAMFSAIVTSPDPNVEVNVQILKTMNPVDVYFDVQEYYDNPIKNPSCADYLTAFKRIIFRNFPNHQEMARSCCVVISKENPVATMGLYAFLDAKFDLLTQEIKNIEPNSKDFLEMYSFPEEFRTNKWALIAIHTFVKEMTILFPELKKINFSN